MKEELLTPIRIMIAICYMKWVNLLEIEEKKQYKLLLDLLVKEHEEKRSKLLNI